MTSYSVSSLSRSVSFYEKVLGMKVVKHDDSGAGSAHLAFAADSKSGVELVGTAAPLIRGDAFVGIGVTKKDAPACMLSAEQNGGKIVRPFAEYGYGASIIPDEDEMVIIPVWYGCIEDPDGYLIEVTEGTRAEPLRKVILNVLDLDETVAYYTQTAGMNLLRRRSNVNSKPKQASMCSFVSFEATEEEGTMLELVYNYATERLTLGNGFRSIAVRGQKSKGSFKDPNEYQLNVL
jgi:catechol 2,3-dioxygenase-like lactoylglutathione lyase family enzyme